MEIFLCRYAIGGHDGNGIVSSVEVFDPRVSSWMMGESLNESRSYSGAAVIADSIYVMGIERKLHIGHGMQIHMARLIFQKISLEVFFSIHLSL